MCLPHFIRKHHVKRSTITIKRAKAQEIVKKRRINNTETKTDKHVMKDYGINGAQACGRTINTSSVRETSLKNECLDKMARKIRQPLETHIFICVWVWVSVFTMPSIVSYEAISVRYYVYRMWFYLWVHSFNLVSQVGVNHRIRHFVLECLIYASLCVYGLMVVAMALMLMVMTIIKTSKSASHHQIKLKHNEWKYSI